jgi:peptide/nickel transport system substrate-binding protein
MDTTSRSSHKAIVSINYRMVARVMLLTLVVLLPAACSSPTPAIPPPAESTSQPAPADTQAPAEPQETVSKDILLDPANAGDADSLMLNGYLYEGLVKLEGGTPVPSLAASWSVSDDGLHYTFKLRPGVVFHDGTPFTADVVLDNFNRWFDPDNPLHGSDAYPTWKDVFLGFKGETNSDGVPVSSFDGVEKADNLTVLLHLNREMPDLIERLSEPAFALVSPAALADDGAVGTGPYAIGERTETVISLQPNANYWGTVPGEKLEFALK